MFFFHFFLVCYHDWFSKMRVPNASRRNRGRSNNIRRNGSGINQVFDGNGSENRVKGNALQVHEKYQALARDAKSSGDRIKAENCDVILVVTSMYNNLIRSYSEYAWKRLIYDEPGHCRVSKMKEIIAGFYWFVTATPNLIFL